VLFKLKKVKKFLKGWGFNLFGNRKRRIKEIHEEIATLEILQEQGFPMWGPDQEKSEPKC
jgi:uncharacterized protein YqgQ